MNRYHCFLIIGSELRPITIEADTVHSDSTLVTKFQKNFTLVCQYPTDRLIIESVEEILDKTH